MTWHDKVFHNLPQNTLSWMAKESPITRFVDTTKQQQVTRSITRVGNAAIASLLSCLALYSILLEPPSKILYPKSPTRGSQPTWCLSKRDNIVNPSIDPMHVVNWERKKEALGYSQYTVLPLPYIINPAPYPILHLLPNSCCPRWLGKKEGRKEGKFFLKKQDNERNTKWSQGGQPLEPFAGGLG